LIPGYHVRVQRLRRHDGRISRTDPGSSLAALRATRAAVGDDIAIMTDLNQWGMPGDTSPALDLAGVRRIAAELADLGVFWLEEPLPGGA
jgi:L-alanine-DL-glutamate epimerase-like enolase superfamily enzyme